MIWGRTLAEHNERTLLKKEVEFKFKKPQLDAIRKLKLLVTTQTSAYEVCDRMRMPLYTPKTLGTCKKKLALFD